MVTTDDVTMGVLRVLTLDDPTQVSLHGQLIERHFPQVETVSRCIPDHPDGIPSAEAEAEALPYIEDLGREMAAEVDVLGVSCALDPGVETLDEEVDIPVVGAGSSVAGAALARGTRVGTLGIEGGTPPNMRSLLGDHHQASETVEGAETTNFLTTEEGRSEIRASVEELARRDCEVVAPACTGLTTSGALPELRSELPVTVVDPVLAMAANALTALFPVERSRETGKRTDAASSAN